MWSATRTENGLLAPMPGTQMTRFALRPSSKIVPNSGAGGGKMLSCWYFRLTSM